MAQAAGGSSLSSSLSRVLKASIRVTFCGTSSSLTSNRARSGSARLYRYVVALIGQGGRSRERFERLKLAGSPSIVIVPSLVSTLEPLGTAKICRPFVSPLSRLLLLLL